MTCLNSTQLCQWSHKFWDNSFCQLWQS